MDDFSYGFEVKSGHMFDYLSDIIRTWYTKNPAAALPAGWAYCNGGAVSVADNSESDWLDGVRDARFVTPNLNANAGYGSRGLFLRGGNSAGTYQDDAFQDHTHSYTMFNDEDWAIMTNSSANTHAGNWHYTWTTNGANSGKPGPETRPVNMTVIWIIRVQ